MKSESILKKIKDFFDGDIDKATTWMLTPNPVLGGIKPVDMILLGREDKLLKYIDFQISENEPEE